MAEVLIRFTPEMENLIIAGKKICTTRLERKGAVGDIFVVRGFVYRLVEIRSYSLDYIATNFYRLEGFSSRDEFIRFWVSIAGYPSFWESKSVSFPAHFFTLVGFCEV
ncbi:MAG TPA: hypothetical protein O0Y06_00025 [Methanocorpusculum sp.]|nr:hypothetical protein [Methanocorpusculum sp.]HJK79274.1 hypothetical protein [Methanocorpusculum sp.]